jgi:hypothetical protein
MSDPAYRSRLTNHLDEIRRLRRARQTWRAIAEYLGNTYGVQITAGGVHIFFKRATRRKQLPLGFEDSLRRVYKFEFISDRSTNSFLQREGI